MKIKPLFVSLLLETGDPTAIRTKDGRMLHGAIAGVDKPTESLIMETQDNEVEVVRMSEIESVWVPQFSNEPFHQPRVIPALIPLAIGLIGLGAEVGTVIAEEIITNGIATESDHYTPPPRFPLPTPAGSMGGRRYHPFDCACGRCSGGGRWLDD
ncbi:hypothetical protein [Pseudomonas fluorescens]|uniref:hypothetical protein n=1 Tax=Pseudomonas TaxID=286 RepID=UPI001469D846|nr:hypothetical protein [Pseudomonas fluorescens]